MNVDQGRKRSFLNRIGSSLSHWIPKLFTLSEDNTTQTNENVVEPQTKRLRQQLTSIPPEKYVGSEISTPMHSGSTSRANLAGSSQNSTLPNRSRFDNLISNSSTPHNNQSSQRLEHYIPVVNLGGDPVASVNNSRASLSQDSPQSYVPSWRLLSAHRGLGGDANFASTNVDVGLDNRSASSLSLRGLDTSSNRSRLNPAVISAMSGRVNISRSTSSSLIHPLSGRYGGTDLRRSPTDAGSTLSISTTASQRSSNVTVKPGRYVQQSLTNTAMLILKELESLSTENMFSVNAPAASQSSTLKSRSYAPYTSSYERFRSRLRQNRLIERSSDDKSATKVPSSDVPSLSKASWNASSKVGQSSGLAPLQKRICISDGGKEFHSKPFSFSEPYPSEQIISSLSSGIGGGHVPSPSVETFVFRSPASLPSGNKPNIQMHVETSGSVFPSTVTKSLESKSSETMASSGGSKLVASNMVVSSDSKASMGSQKVEWICRRCFVTNKSPSAVCSHCNSPNPSNDKEPQSANSTTTSSSTKTTISTFDSSSTDTFNNLLASNRSKWCCEVCLVDNDPKETCCVACSAPRPTKNIKNLPPKLSSTIENSFQKVSQDNQSKCLVPNDPDASVCVTYTLSKANPTQASSSAIEKSNSSTDTFAKLIAANRLKWTCDVCLVQNEPQMTACLACSTPKPKTSKESSLSLAPKESAFKDVPKNTQSKWTSDTCLVTNAANVSSCVSCTVPVSKQVQISSSHASTSNSEDTFAKFLAASRLKWTCDVCSVANEPDATTCAACTTPNPNSSVSKESAKSVPVSENKFASFLSSIAQKWNCSTCSIANEAEEKCCSSCGASRTNSTPVVRFGMPDTTNDAKKSDPVLLSYERKSSESVFSFFGQSGPSGSSLTPVAITSKSEIPFSFTSPVPSNPLVKSTDPNVEILPTSSASTVSSVSNFPSLLPSQATTSLFSFGQKKPFDCSSTVNSSPMFSFATTSSATQPSIFSFGKSDALSSTSINQSTQSSTSSTFSLLAKAAPSIPFSFTTDQPPSKRSFGNSQCTNLFGKLSQEPNNNVNKIDGEGVKTPNGFDFSKSSFSTSAAPSHSVAVNGFSTVSTPSVPVTNFPFSSGSSSAIIFKSATTEVGTCENGSSSPITSQRIIKKAVRRVNRA